MTYVQGEDDPAGNNDPAFAAWWNESGSRKYRDRLIQRKMQTLVNMFGVGSLMARAIASFRSTFLLDQGKIRSEQQERLSSYLNMEYSVWVSQIFDRFMRPHYRDDLLGGSLDKFKQIIQPYGAVVNMVKAHAASEVCVCLFMSCAI